MSNTTSENGNVDDSGPSRDADSPSSVGESLARRLKALSSLLPSLRRDRSKAADSDVGPQQLEACSDHLDDDANEIDAVAGGRLRGWFLSLAGFSPTDSISSAEAAEDRELLDQPSPGLIRKSVSAVGAAGGVAVDATRDSLVAALIAGVRAISNERDRDDVLKWFANAEHILSQSETKGVVAKQLYRSVSSRRLAELLFNTAKTSINNYRGTNLPLALKIALPVTAIAAAVLGAKGAGIVAFGTGVGLPVVLLLFLGVVGVGTILEAFVKDPTVRDPLTRLLVTFSQLEAQRRADKAFLDALRADAMVPQRSDVPAESALLVSHLREMDPVAFERHVMSFFEKQGHPVGLTARSNDFGVDGYVCHPDGLIVVQCKRNSEDNAVGRPIVQQFKGVIEEQKAYRGYIVTTSRFTEEARSSAEQNDRIRLIDWQELLVWHERGAVGS